MPVPIQPHISASPYCRWPPHWPFWQWHLWPTESRCIGNLLQWRLLAGEKRPDQDSSSLWHHHLYPKQHVGSTFPGLQWFLVVEWHPDYWARGGRDHVCGLTYLDHLSCRIFQPNKQVEVCPWWRTYWRSVEELSGQDDSGAKLTITRYYWIPELGAHGKSEGTLYIWGETMVFFWFSTGSIDWMV